MPEILNESVKTRRSHDQPPESLKNRISAKDMGTRVVRTGAQLGKKPQSMDPKSPMEDLVAEMFTFFNDMPEEVVNAAARALVSIMHSDISEEERKSEIEELLDHKIGTTELETFRSIAGKIPRGAQSVEDVDDMDNMDDVDGLDGFEDNTEDLNEFATSTNDLEGAVAGDAGDDVPLFVALNDPVRIRDKTLVLPHEIDSYWLDTKLRDTNMRSSEALEVLKDVEELEEPARLRILENKLGIESFGLAQLLAKNTGVVLWYTLLAKAADGVEREEVMDEINARGLSLEQVAGEHMDQDLPRELDLSVTGRPVNVPLYLNLKLPAGSTRFKTHDYEQYNVPANEPVLNVDWPLKPVSELPEYAQPSFSALQTLNIVQSKVSDVVVNTDVNVLLCAPTGAGKSNVALLALTRCLHVHGNRAVYIAPLKALVQEQVQTLQARLPDMTVAELSGDQSISREQLQSVDVIVSTPEKWDIVSRKAQNVDLVRSIGLVVVDEIHLLHDERRGAVIENIVARHKRQAVPPRLLGLSATLPNYEDVAAFLDVPRAGLFFFDSRFRPVPLEQQFLGVMAPGPLKQLRIINEACATKVTEVVVKGKKQALVFVHSRKDTAATRDLLVEKTELSADQIGIHHAGLDRDERASSEQKFRSGQFRVLVCTATLAWGVNLPAAAVIIKGTQYYDPSLEGWKQLGPQDVMQMFGRAGRPGFDSQGLGIIITTQKYLGYFASIASLSLSIQSNLMAHITDSLNAEIVTYSVKTIDEAVSWIKQTFWAVRFKSDPAMYGDDYTFEDIAHSALLHLHNAGACRYEYPRVRPTFQGDLAAEFYISPDSVALYIRQMKPWMADIDLIRVFARSAEFASLSVRRGDVGEIRRLAQLVPFPLRDDLDTKYAKIAILLQAYISRLPLTGLALGGDMIYIAQSASRLFRAFFELALALKWSRLARISHNLFLMVDKRLWGVGQSYFRQFESCPPELLERVESSQLPWQRYFDLEEADLGEIFRLENPKLASTAYGFLSRFPRFSVSAECRPVSTEWALVTVEIEPMFEYDSSLHLSQERFWLWIETQSGNLLFHRSFSLKELLLLNSRDNEDETVFRTTARVKLHASALTRKYTPYLFVRLLSDRWLGSESEATASLRKLEPPSHITASSLISEEAMQQPSEPVDGDSHNSFTLANALRPLLEASDRNAYIGMPPCTEQQDCIDIAVQHAVRNDQQVLLVSPYEANLETRRQQYSELPLKYLQVNEGERLSRSPSALLDAFSDVEYIVCEDLHRLGSIGGEAYELLVTRLLAKLTNVRRIIGFGYPVTSARSIAQWLGASKSDVVNFGFDVVKNAPHIVLRPWRPLTLLTSFRSVAKDIAKTAGSVLLVVANFVQCQVVAQECELQGIDGASIVEHRSDNNHTGVRIATLSTAVDLDPAFDLVVLFGSLEVAPSDLLKAVGLARSSAIIFSDRLEFDESCVNDPLPLESNLAPRLADALIPAISNGEVFDPQGAVDWLSKTFLYRRLRANAAYYGSQDLQDWVSEAIESTFEKLAAVGAVSMDDETLEVEPLALCHIVSREGVELDSVLSPTDTGTLRDFNDSIRILNARIDYAVAMNRLSLLFSAADERQALCRHVQTGTSPLLQIPEVTDDVVLRCRDAQILSIQDFIAIEDDDLRTQLLGFDNEDERMVAVAEFVNQFPVVDITRATLVDNESVAEIHIERDIEPDDDIMEDGWYLVVGNSDADEIWGFRHLGPIRSSEVTISLKLRKDRTAQNTPQTGTTQTGTTQIGTTQTDTPENRAAQNGSVWLICGSYIDADKEFPLSS